MYPDEKVRELLEAAEALIDGIGPVTSMARLQRAATALREATPVNDGLCKEKRALANIMLFTARALARKNSPLENAIRRDAETILRFCKEAGFEPTILRERG